ncbi:uncharacterized protein L3040_008677 [Drepanopeziza brunnea f. sp. 'multigermtubi']|uniref:uncharacterized protein n=1 Tax=Drepanopeziza brunnea f. sp. 'multigermtubi' TaxID=698441 RepID=UPI002386624A|nr:hypothetical protein L3040_008677 [Drepanopeziza brunnea f. sp. 'multigermtubi']
MVSTLLTFTLAVSFSILAQVHGSAIPNSRRSDGILRLPVTAVRSTHKREEHTALYNIQTGTRYMIEFTLGSPPQSHALQLDTGSSETMLNPTCALAGRITSRELCEYFPHYIANASTTARDLKLSTTFTYGKGGGTIRFFSDDFVIGESTITAQQFGLTTTSHDLPVGLLGVGPGIELTGYPTLVDNLAIQNITNSRAFSIDLRAYDTEAGAVIFGGIDTGKYIGALQKLPIIPPGEAPDKFARYWVYMNSIGITKPGEAKKLYTLPSTDPRGQPVFLDSGGTLTRLPSTLVNAIVADFPGAVNDGGSGLYLVDCATANKTGSIHFGFGDTVIDVPYRDFMWHILGMCYLGITIDEDLPVLGASFLRGAFVVFDQDNQNVHIAQSGDCGTNLVPIGKGPDAVPSLVGGCGSLPRSSSALPSTVQSGTSVTRSITETSSPAPSTAGSLTQPAGASATSPGSPPVAPPKSGPPAVQTPGVVPPTVQTPGVEPPAVQTPGVGPPAVQTPGVEPPTVQTPGVEPPTVQTPGVEPPAVQTPGVGPPAVYPPGSGPPAVQTPGVGPPAVYPPGSGPPAVQTPGVGSPAVYPPGSRPSAVQTPGAGSPTYVPGSPANVPGSAVYVPGSPANVPGSPAYVPGSPAKIPGSPAYVPGSPANVPGSPAYVPGSPAYVPGSPANVPGSPAYVPGSPAYVPGSPANVPGSPANVPGSPAYVPGSPAYVPGSPAYVPGSPAYVPGSPAKIPGSPAYVPGSGPPAVQTPGDGSPAYVPGSGPPAVHNPGVGYPAAPAISPPPESTPLNTPIYTFSSNAVTKTIFATQVYTITACAASVTDCPIGKVTTTVVPEKTKVRIDKYILATTTGYASIPLELVANPAPIAPKIPISFPVPLQVLPDPAVTYRPSPTLGPPAGLPPVKWDTVSVYSAVPYPVASGANGNPGYPYGGPLNVTAMPFLSAAESTRGNPWVAVAIVTLGFMLIV